MKTDIRRKLLWQNGYAAYAVTFMKEIQHLRFALCARHLQRSSSSRTVR
jgi:hypothetical protein